MKEDLQEQEKELLATEKQITQVEASIAEFEKEKGKRLKQHEEIQFFAEDLNAWQNLQKEQKNNTTQIEEIQQNLKNFQQKRTHLQTEFSSTFQLNISPQNASEKLNNYKEKVRTLIAERSELLSVYRTSEQHISGLLKDFQFNSKPSNTAVFQQELKEKQHEKSNIFEKLNKKFQLEEKSVSAWQEEIQQQLKLTRAAEKQDFQLLQLKKELNQKSEELRKINDSLKDLPQQVEKLQQELKLKNAQLEAKQKTLEESVTLIHSLSLPLSLSLS